MMESCCSHFDSIWPVPTYLINLWTGLNRYFFIMAIFAELLGLYCGPLCNSIFPILSSPSVASVGIWKPSSASTPQVGFMCSKASLIREERSKSQGRRRIGGEVLCSGVPLGSLAGFWDERGSVRSTPWSEIEKTWRDFHNFHQCWRQSLAANWFKSWCFAVVPVPYVSREQDGCLRLSLFLSMNFEVTQNSRQSSYVIVHDMWCQWWVLLFSLWQHLACAHLLNQFMNRIEQVFFFMMAIFAELLGL